MPKYLIDRLNKRDHKIPLQNAFLILILKKALIKKEGTYDDKDRYYSGFLGAGKTTFIKKLLQEAISGEQVVLIENEFGEIGIDGGF